MLRKSVLSNFVSSLILPVRKPLPRGLKGTNPIPSSSRVGNTASFRVPPPERVFALNCRDRLNCVCATDGLRACFRKAKVLNLTFLNQFLHRSRHVFDGHVRVNTVLIEQIDGIDLESVERGLGDLLDAFGPTIQAWKGINVEPELRGYHHLPTEGGEGFAHEF